MKPLNMPLSNTDSAATRGTPLWVYWHTSASSLSTSTLWLANQNSISTRYWVNCPNTTGASPLPSGNGDLSRCCSHSLSVLIQPSQPRRLQRRAIASSTACPVTPKPSLPAHSSNPWRKVPGFGPRGNRWISAPPATISRGVCGSRRSSSKSFCACALSGA
ncbi:hypothetical protein D3C76_904620 [compost metagenome]